MGWGRIDDRFDDHPKVLALLDEDDQLLAAAAIGLWSLCFTWAHRNTRKHGQVPGRVPAGLPRRYLGQHAKAAAELLVRHNLWETQEDGAWLFHDFNDYLPTEETKHARSEAGKRGAAKRWAGHKTAGADSNLPSASHDGDSKLDGNLMATDGSGMADDATPADGDAGDGAGQYNGAQVAGVLFGDTSESAGDDGKLPSGCHPADSNAVANDGSRTQARRAISKEIASRTHSQTSSSSGIAGDPDGDDEEAEDAGAEPEPYREDVDRICRHLIARMVGNGYKRPTLGVAWRREGRLLLDRDGRSVEQVIAAIDWAHDHPFWKSNIKSMPKLRHQYDTLRLQAQAEKLPKNSNGKAPVYRDGDRGDLSRYAGYLTNPPTTNAS